ncbi:hypothetical protein ACWEPC_40920 [Nonomuraea sp. NPDC004297]
MRLFETERPSFAVSFPSTPSDPLTVSALRVGLPMVMVRVAYWPAVSKPVAFRLAAFRVKLVSLTIVPAGTVQDVSPPSCRTVPSPSYRWKKSPLLSQVREKAAPALNFVLGTVGLSGAQARKLCR